MSAPANMPGPEFFGDHVPPKLTTLPFDDLFAPEPAAKLIVPTLGIAPGPVHMLVAPWGTGKSMVQLALGTAVAAGAPAFGVYSVQRGRWLHIDLEMGRRSIKRYIPRLIAGVVGEDRERVRGFIDVAIKPAVDFAAMSARDFAGLIDGYTLVTCDPFRRFAGNVDENSSEVRGVLDRAADASELAQVPIVMIQHAGHTDPTGKRPRREVGRGSSAINDAIQSKFVLTRDDKGGDIRVSHEKTRELPAELPDFGLRIVDVAVGSNALGGLRVEHLEREQVATSAPRQSARFDALKSAVLATVAEHTTLTSKNAICARVTGGAKDAKLQAIAELLAEGELVQPGGEGSEFRVRR